MTKLICGVLCGLCCLAGCIVLVVGALTILF